MTTTDERQSRRLEDVQLILKDLLKVIKVVSMYPEDNPLPQSLRRTFAERLADIVESYSDIEISVNRDKLYYDGEPAFSDRSREESLAGMFHENGITRFTFREGLEVEDIYALLDVIKDYQNSFDPSRDLTNAIWEAAIDHFTFATIEDIALAEYEGDFQIKEVFLPHLDSGQTHRQAGNVTENYMALFTRLHDEDTLSPEEGDGICNGEEMAATDDPGLPGAVPGKAVSPRSVTGKSVLDTGDAEEDRSLMLTTAAEAMGLGDLAGQALPPVNTALILNDKLKLSGEETAAAAEIAEADAEFDVCESTAELLKELLHHEPEMSGFYETVTIGEKVLTELVRIGKLTFASDVLRYFKTIQEQIQSSKPLWAERLKDARATLGSRDRLQTLTEALNEQKELGSLELRGYLDNFGWEALMGITDILSELKHQHHRETVSDYLALRGKDNMEIVARGIYDKRSEVALASVNILGRISDDRALTHLKKVVDHRELKVRLALVKVLQDSPHDDALEMLRRMVNDPDASIRKQAVESIVARRGQAAFDVITDIINNRQFAHLDPDDKGAVLDAYSVLGGDMAVEYLVSLIKKVNPFGNTTTAFYRDVAFRALALNRGQRAEKALLQLSSSWRPDIKTGAVAAMKRRRELIFGDADDQHE
jgi:hypothetical protein